MYRIIVLVFVLLALSKVFFRYRDGLMKGPRLIFWIAFWLGIGVLGMIPQMTDPVTQMLGVGRGADLFFFLAILLLSYLLFTTYNHVNKLEQDVTRLVRALALKDLELEQQRQPQQPTDDQSAPG